MTVTPDATPTGPCYPAAPQVAVGAVVFKDGRVLMVRRGKAPARGQWAIPGGSVHLGESLQQAAQREIYEETGIRIAAGRPVYVFDVVDAAEDGRVRYHYVIVDLEASYQGGDLRCGDDALEARWVTPEELQALDVNAATRRLLQQRYGFGDRREEPGDRSA